MHEQSLMKQILRQVDAIRAQHAGEVVSEVRIEIGPLAGVEPLLLEAAFQQLAPQTSAAAARFVIDETPLTAECRSCRQEFEVQEFDFRCPSCGAGVRIVRGDELRLISITLHDAASLQEQV